MSRDLGITGVALTVIGVLLIGAGAAVGGAGREVPAAWGYGTFGMGGHRMPHGGPMMGWAPVGDAGPGPGDDGFVPGTEASPRVVPVIAGPGMTFTPSVIEVRRGETVTFQVTSMGGLVHEFMVGPAADVANHVAGTPEVDGLGMMETGSLTYTFDGPGPFAYACHEPGHYEAGMAGSITVVD